MSVGVMRTARGSCVASGWHLYPLALCWRTYKHTTTTPSYLCLRPRSLQRPRCHRKNPSSLVFFPFFPSPSPPAHPRTSSSFSSALRSLLIHRLPHPASGTKEHSPPPNVVPCMFTYLTPPALARSKRGGLFSAPPSLCTGHHSVRARAAVQQRQK